MYRKKAPAPRLCADDVMSRANLKRYQNTYAEAMQKYGLQRGIEGSEAQHISTHEYYRSLMAQGKDIQEDVEALLKQKEQAEQELSKIKSEKKTEELKNTAAQTATTALKGINSLLGSNKICRLEKENEQLKGVVKQRDSQIIKLQADMQQQNEFHASDMRYTKLQMQSSINDKQRTIDKILRWFPIVGEYLRIEKECFSVTAKITRIAKDRLQLTVEQSPIVLWIQQQLERNQNKKIIEEKVSNHHGFHL